MSDWVMAYQNYDDDEVYVPVTEEPDLDSVAQRYANETGLLVASEGRRTVRTQDCECMPASDDCDGLGLPCVVQQQECWVLVTFDGTLPGRRDAERWLEDADDKRIWEPVP